MLFGRRAPTARLVLHRPNAAGLPPEPNPRYVKIAGLKRTHSVPFFQESNKAQNAEMYFSILLGLLHKTMITHSRAVGPAPRNLVHHSDRGSVYRGTRYQVFARLPRHPASMSRKGDRWDNAVTERASSAPAKSSCIRWACRANPKPAAPLLVPEAHYNRRRRHSTLCSVSPCSSMPNTSNNSTTLPQILNHPVHFFEGRPLRSSAGRRVACVLPTVNTSI